MALAVICALASGCSKFKKLTQVEPDPEPTPAVVATPVPVAPKASTPVAAAATAVPKRLAPEGVYFLVQKKSVETADGITGFKPGTPVKKQADGTYLAEGKVLTLRPEEVTNDLDIAARVAGMDAQRQAAIRQVSALQAAAAATPAASLSGASYSTVAASSSSSSSQAPASNPPPRSSSQVGSAGGLGQTHSMTRDGWLWEKNEWGTWRRVRPLR